MSFCDFQLPMTTSIDFRFDCPSGATLHGHLAGTKGAKDDSSDSKVYGANMGPIWGRQVPGGPHVGLMNFAIWIYLASFPNECCGIAFSQMVFSLFIFWYNIC